MKNFAFPYFSRDIAEFWRRWHISLTSWFRDYLYIPLGGSQGGIWITVRNIFIIFIVSGFWHGANWTFIAWGTLNAIYFLPLLLLKANRQNIEIVAKGKWFPDTKVFLQILLTFGMTTIAWVFFRAENINHAFSYVSGIFSKTIFSAPNFCKKGDGVLTVALILIFIGIEWLGRENEFAIEKFSPKWPRIIRWLIYLALCSFIFLFQGKQQEFIYFQF